MKKLFTVILAWAAMSSITASPIAEHRVKRHENLFRISLIYNTTVADLLAANPGVDQADLKVGTRLVVPVNTKVRDAAFVNKLLANPVNAAPIAETDPFNNSQDHRKVKAAKFVHDETEATEAAMPASSSAMEYESGELRDRYEELKKMEGENQHMRVVDVSTVKLDPNATNYAEPMRMLNQSIDMNKIMVVNLQIVMKDGTTKTVSSPEEQKKLLNQLMAGAN
ncbi:MAG: LysM domain-containing protein [Chitinophagales bacterium]